MCVIPLLGILTKFVIDYINTKKDELIVKTQAVQNEEQRTILQKYINMAQSTVETCVVATNQTFVDALKDKNEFTSDDAKEAFNQTYTNVVAILSDEAKKYLTEAYGDLDTYLTQLIEASVNQNKKINSSTSTTTTTTEEKEQTTQVEK